MRKLRFFSVCFDDMSCVESSACDVFVSVQMINTKFQLKNWTMIMSERKGKKVKYLYCQSHDLTVGA